jgi:hypothetical protein
VKIKLGFGKKRRKEAFSYKKFRIRTTLGNSPESALLAGEDEVSGEPSNFPTTSFQYPASFSLERDERIGS